MEEWKSRKESDVRSTKIGVTYVNLQFKYALETPGPFSVNPFAG